MRFQRPDYVDRQRQPKAMVMTPRDQRILEHIYAHGGVLADYQIEQLEFTGGRQRQDRMSKLFHNGYVWRTSRAGHTLCGCAVYWLAHKGAEYVAGAQGLSVAEFTRLYTREPRWSQIGHDLLAVDFTLHLMQACQADPDLELYEWWNERDFRIDPDAVRFQSVKGKRMQRNVIPDRFFIIDRLSAKAAGEPFRSRLLLELDNATHPNKRFANEKALPGTAYIQSEVYERRFGSNTGRWLVVTTGPRRVEYLKSTTERAVDDYASIWYFTTFAQVTVERLLTEPIWLRGGDTQPVALLSRR
jgi:hypothetical protein